MIDWEQARQLFRDGLDTLDIARHFGVHEAEIYNGFAQGRSDNVVPASKRVGMQDLIGTGKGLPNRPPSTDPSALSTNPYLAASRQLIDAYGGIPPFLLGSNSDPKATR